MSLRAADLRFALPAAARSAVVLGDVEGWREGLDRAGIEAAQPPPMVVAAAGRAREAQALEPRLLIIDGGARVGKGWSTTTIVPLPNPDEPELLLPTGGGDAVRYAIRHWRAGGLRNTVAREALARGVPLPGRRRVTVAARKAGPPFFVARALEVVSATETEWFAAFGRFADAFSRGVFSLLPRGRTEPEWVVKFARLPGLGHLFDGDERGLAEARRAPAVVADRAPRLVARFAVEGLEASVETAATGERLPILLEQSEHSDGLAAIERVAGWIRDLAAETVGPAEALEPERRRVEDALARATTHGLQATPLSFGGVRPVFQHGDLNSDNVFLATDGLELVDWESARRFGFPLWDVFFFLTDALAIVDGVDSQDARIDHFVRLWRGEIPSSAVLFRWTRAVAEASGVDASAVGELATALWFSYALSDTEELAQLGRTDLEPPTLKIARRWVSEPGLGPGWQPA